MTHLLPILRNARDSKGDNPILIHVKTQKGKGYIPAEASPDKMHGVKKFDVVTGKQAKSIPNALLHQSLRQRAHHPSPPRR